MRYPERLSFLAARRGLVPRFAGTAYVAAAVLHVEQGQGFRPWSMGALALVLSAASARREARASSWAMWGASVTLASVGTSRESPWIDGLGMIGALVATAAACVALAQMSARAPQSLARRAPRSPRVAIAILAVAWSLAIAASVATAVHAGGWLAEYHWACAVAAGVLSITVLIGSTEATLRERALVLGVADRARVLRAIAIAAALFAAGAAMLEPNTIDRALRLGVACSGGLISVVALYGDAVRVVRGWRRATVLGVFGGSVAMLASLAAVGRPWEAATIVFAATVAALLVGSAAPYLELSLRPMEGAWLDAVQNARAALARSIADAAIHEALALLRAPAGPAATSPELWTLDPVRVLTIDAAGYPHERASELPETLLGIASAEPEATLRADVLDALQVRRPDLRALARWLEDRGVWCATVIAAEGEPKGMLLLPRGRRVEAMTLEEACAIKLLADTLAGACEAKSALSRSLGREQALVQRGEVLEERLLRLEQAEALDVGRHVLAASRAARPTTVGVYSAASRLAFEALEGRVRSGAPVAVVAPSGVDPVPYLARAHLGGPRRTSPLVIVDGTASREHDLTRWTDPLASPLALADRGMLVLLDGASLPVDVQRLVARVLAERRPPWERPDPLDVTLVLTGTLTPTALLEAGRLDPALATRLGDAGDAPIVLPRLSERPEDVRAILSDRLAREGLRVRGTPIGVEDAAFARLAEYSFPGEDAELASMVLRLVASLRGDVVRAADIDALELRRPAPRESPRVVRGDGS